MHVVHLSWEFPPVVYGGLGRYVEQLSRAQVEGGDEVTVVSVADDVRGARAGGRGGRPDAPPAETVDGVAVLRVPGPSGGDDLATAVRAMQDAMVRAAGGLRPDVVHAHDWMVADAARRLADAAGCPVVLTVHATELGRRQGRLDDDVHRAVHAAERHAVAVADRVVVCSSAMVEEVAAHGADLAAVVVVPAAVEASRWDVRPADRAAARGRHAAPHERLVVAAGRLEWEKGFSTLLRALPGLRERHADVRVVLAGTGSYAPALRALATEVGAVGTVTFAGHLDVAELAPLLAAADAVVVPSRYEPFGLVALEAQATGAPVVVTRTGGLAGTVEDGVTG
ncbi:glycosyltransferase family 4 protein, partial [Angustibacter peucedani]